MNSISRINSYWKDIFFQASGNTVAQIIGIIAMPILTRLYVPETFAIQAVFTQIVIFLTAFISFRFEYFLQLLINVAESNSLMLWIASVGFLMTVLFTSAIFVLNIVGFFEFFNISMSGYFYLAPITAYLICMSVVFQHEAQRQGDFKGTAIAAVASKVGYVTSGMIFYFLLGNLGLILTTALGAITKIISLHKYLFLFLFSIKKTKINKDLIINYKGRSQGMVFANTILTLSGLLPILFISKQYGIATLGQFSLVMATVFLPSGLIGSAVGNVFYQRAAQFWNDNDFIGLKTIWYETLIKLFLFALPVYFLIYFISSWAYPFVFGVQWIQAGSFAKLMALAAFFSFLAGPLDRISLVIGVGYYLPLIHLLRLVMIVLSIFLALLFNLKDFEYLLVFSIGMSFIYLIDIVSCRFYFLEKQIKCKQ